MQDRGRSYGNRRYRSDQGGRIFRRHHGFEGSDGIHGRRDTPKNRPEDEVKKSSLPGSAKRNYIPDRAKDEYGKAFLREFKKFLGKAGGGRSARRLEIKVLGQGCAQCDRLEQELMAVMAETGVAADVDHVRDVKEIGKYGVLGMPALIINGKVKSVGKCPAKADLRNG